MHLNLLQSIDMNNQRRIKQEIRFSLNLIWLDNSDFILETSWISSHHLVEWAFIIYDNSPSIFDICFPLK